MNDEQFFQQHPGRRARIRSPAAKMVTEPKTRQARVVTESEGEFWSLGPHDRTRRRIIVWRCPHDHPTHPDHLLVIPFLAYADEEIADRDDILLPIVHELMRNAR